VAKLDEANAALTPAGPARPRRSSATRSARSCARRARSCATCARRRQPRDEHARPHAVVQGAQQPLQPDRLQRGRPQGPENKQRDEGYLFWIAWLGHNGGTLFSSSSNTGILRPIALQATCATIRQTIADEPELEFLQGLTGVLFDERVCATGG
jgi:hypothetical protein